MKTPEAKRAVRVVQPAIHVREFRLKLRALLGVLSAAVNRR